MFRRETHQDVGCVIVKSYAAGLLEVPEIVLFHGEPSCLRDQIPREVATAELHFDWKVGFLGVQVKENPEWDRPKKLVIHKFYIFYIYNHGTSFPKHSSQNSLGSVQKLLKNPSISAR